MDIGEALISALQEKNVDRVYVVAGDYVLNFLKRIEESPIELICMAGEEGAGFAADAHARLHGFAAVVVTYGVGALKLLNPIAGAFAERSPVLVISGAPGVRESHDHELLHHKIKATDTQQRFFDEICAESARLDSARTAAGSIAKVIAAMERESRPGYLELPRDCMTRTLPWPLKLISPHQEKGDYPLHHRDICEQLLQWMRTRKRPIVLAGLELHRYGLQSNLAALLEREGWPFVTTLSAKTLLSERHPNYLGIYEGAMSSETVTSAIENSDGVLQIGAPLSDLDSGIFTANLNPSTTITVEMEQGTISPEGIEDALDPRQLLEIFLELGPPPQSKPIAERLSQLNSSTEQPSFTPRNNEPIKLMRLIAALRTSLQNDSILLADPGDALFSSALDLRLPNQGSFLTSGYWASLGFAVPAAVGAWGAKPSLRPVVISGDGSFLMSVLELATMVRYGIPAFVIVLDNKGYGTERPILDGCFNDIAPVNHEVLARAYGFVDTARVETEEQLWSALTRLQREHSGPTLMSVDLQPDDRSTALTRLTQSLSQRVKVT
ncbi:MAG: thiamine pyrophosphate-dependent enzyme [Cyanobacteria bacterium P01_H01_bin.15]